MGKEKRSTRYWNTIINAISANCSFMSQEFITESTTLTRNLFKLSKQTLDSSVPNIIDLQDSFFGFKQNESSLHLFIYRQL
jgi:hypothetical protein